MESITNSHRLNLNHLAAFFAVAETKSVSKGAERLMVSQPAVSRQLKELERRLKTPLFDRLPRGVRLTQAGSILAGYARRLFAIADEATHVMDELRGIRRGRLSVAASTTLGIYFLPDLFVRFRREHPAVQLNMQIASSDEAPELLRQGIVDVALTETAVEGADFDSAKFMEDRLIAIVPARHPLARRRTITAKELCREPFVVRETSSGTQSLVERALAARRFSVKPAMSLGSTEAIKRAVIAGVGVAVVSHLAVQSELLAKRLIALPVTDLSLRRSLWHVTLRGCQPGAVLQAFDRILDTAAAEVKAKPPDARRSANA